MKKLIRKFLLKNYQAHKRFILLKFRYDVLRLIREIWFRRKLSNNFNEIVTELKNGNETGFNFLLQGGGNSYQRRKQKRMIMQNLVANFYNYS